MHLYLQIEVRLRMSFFEIPTSQVALSKSSKSTGFDCLFKHGKVIWEYGQYKVRSLLIYSIANEALT